MWDSIWRYQQLEGMRQISIVQWYLTMKDVTINSINININISNSISNSNKRYMSRVKRVLSCVQCQYTMGKQSD